MKSPGRLFEPLYYTLPTLMFIFQRRFRYLLFVFKTGVGVPGSSAWGDQCQVYSEIVTSAENTEAGLVPKTLRRGWCRG